MIDIFTVIPIWMTYLFFHDLVPYDAIVTTGETIAYILHAAFTLRILRALRLYRRCSNIEDEVERFLTQLLIQVITMMFFGDEFFNFTIF